jgi:hypothetical protein
VSAAPLPHLGAEDFAMKQDARKNLPAVIDGTATVVAPFAVESGSEDFHQEPPIEIIIDSRQLKERIIDYLGAVLARCWIDLTLLDRISVNPHRALRQLGILLPDEIDIKVERNNTTRPRLVIYEWNQERSYRRRICYLQLVMMAGK